MIPEPRITCVECGGQAYLLTTYPPDDPPHPGDPAAYRCEDCGARWDVIVEDAEFPEGPSGLRGSA